jgi:2,4-dienoyl-CoA reductase-like NADH-dependent reductase (Old Yellow Enzyme family)
MTDLSAPLSLPCGLTLPNRIAKAAMTEGLADPKHRPTDRLERLYRLWGEGGAGLLITGNVIVDRAHLERPGNVVLTPDPPKDLPAGLARWAQAGQVAGAKVLVQLSHAGRQTLARINARPVAPSPVALRLPGKLFAPPRALAGSEIPPIVSRFVEAAKRCAEAGFDGVQVHAAHGYLISQFLSPLSNQRTDGWGGPLHQRVRFLREVVQGIRAACPPPFAVAVKLNSADFQRGGFGETDALSVADWLVADGVDLIEVSGGTYEQPRMAGVEGLEPGETPLASTVAREAYFLHFAKLLKSRVTVPVMVTGGFRTRAGMQAALTARATDLVGLARPLVVQPDLPKHLLDGAREAALDVDRRLRLGPGQWLGPASPVAGIKMANVFGAQGWYCQQIRRLAMGQQVNLKMPLWRALLDYQRDEAQALKALSR